MRSPWNPVKDWCRGRESNPHTSCDVADFKSAASPSFATPARTGEHLRYTVMVQVDSAPTPLHTHRVEAAQEGLEAALPHRWVRT